ncbi:MAG: adenylate/guanylate cyclase domain-containing protein [Gammaproteobacteria bacterium]|nr:adenylate/guanylate cyclase domain-containing protein [Gammaproteobacteria bacterium]
METRHSRFQFAVWLLRAAVFSLYGALLFMTPAEAFPGADVLTTTLCGVWLVAVRRIKAAAWAESLCVSGCGFLGVPDTSVALAGAFTFGLCHLALLGWRGLPGISAVMLMLLLVHTSPMRSEVAIDAGSIVLLGAGVFGVAWIAYGRQVTTWQRLTRARTRAERLLRYLPLSGLASRFEEDVPYCEMQRVWLVAVFVDLSGFTSATARCVLADVEELIQSFVTKATSEARRFGGVVMKLMGDGALVVFPAADCNCRGEAVSAAIGFAGSMVRREFFCGTAPRLELGVRAGVASGECALGDWSADDVLDYSVIGLSINMAARLQSSAGDRRILIYPQTAMHLDSDLQTAGRTSLWLNGIGAINATRICDPLS